MARDGWDGMGWSSLVIGVLRAPMVIIKKINFLLSSWDIGFSSKRHYIMEVGALRFPFTLFNSIILDIRIS